MSTTSAQHDTFVIERRLPSSPARVFAAFADPTKKARWFGCVEGWEVAEHTLDFRVGGREVWRGGPPGDTPHRNDTYYHDIVRDVRIVWSYAMQVGGKRISVSLATLELSPDGTGTQLRFIEQGVYLDGHDGLAERERGTKDLLDNLERALREDA
ncbi:MAG TPA: SRPBCC family protein [Gemmatimonadaceae bacterium]|nr:SRPBCC family protein [Gemmatimonadaceae bacterium]